MTHKATEDGLVHISVPEDVAKGILKDAGLDGSPWYCLNVTIHEMFAKPKATKPEPGTYVARFNDGRSAELVTICRRSGESLIALANNDGTIWLKNIKELIGLCRVYNYGATVHVDDNNWLCGPFA